MISFGFSARHWQQIDAGRPITMTTLLQHLRHVVSDLGQIMTIAQIGDDMAVFASALLHMEPSLTDFQQPNSI